MWWAGAASLALTGPFSVLHMDRQWDQEEAAALGIGEPEHTLSSPAPPFRALTLGWEAFLTHTLSDGHSLPSPQLTLYQVRVLILDVGDLNIFQNTAWPKQNIVTTRFCLGPLLCLSWSSGAPGGKLSTPDVQ